MSVKLKENSLMIKKNVCSAFFPNRYMSNLICDLLTKLKAKLFSCYSESSK